MGTEYCDVLNPVYSERKTVEHFELKKASLDCRL